MSLQSQHPHLRAVPYLGAAVSVCMTLAIFAALLAVALQGVGLVEW
jgi:hypothetical protein